MKTITVKTDTYKFNELSETGKEKAIQCFLQDDDDDYLWGDDNIETLKAFEYIFNVTHTDYSYGGYTSCYINFSINYDNEILNLKGLRLLRYIHNNYYKYLFKEKYIGNIKGREKFTPMYSKCQKDWEYSNSEEAIIEDIEANNYNFTIDGELF